MKEARVVLWALVVGVLAAGPAAALETPAYKCVGAGRVVYSQVPCAGGREVGAASVRETDRHKAPPQDRAKAARRAMLTAEVRQECTVLDARVQQQERDLKAKGPGATLQDETPLVKTRLRYRELRC